MKQRETTGSYARYFESAPVSVEAGEKYNFGGSYYFEDSGTGDIPSNYTYFVQIVWIDSAGKEDSEPFSGTDFTTFRSWTEVSLPEEEAPPKTTSAKLRVRVKGPNNDETDVFWDQMFIEKAN